MTKLFKRTELASEVADKILFTSPTSASSSGLFLAAPRRTGKSTFLREDLRPQLEAKGALVLYVDLWENRQTDPGDAIVNAIRTELAKHDGVIKRLVKSTGLDKVSIAGTSFSLDKLGLAQGISLSAALSALSDDAQTPIVLVIDEAQHAITTEGGTNALFALKAARDELNSTRHYGLRVVATGSNQDKLAMLRNSKDQAFFGAPLVRFPSLGREYVEWFCAHANLDASIDPDVVFDLFSKASFRPEILGAAADTLRFEFGVDKKDVASRFYEEIQLEIDSTNKEAMRVIHSLTPLQSAVFQVLATTGPDYAPFEARTMVLYKDAMSRFAAESAVSPDLPNVQQALVALQEKGLVWKAARGVYALEDTSLGELLRLDSKKFSTPATDAAERPEI
jgi:hypothetical protein